MVYVVKVIEHLEAYYAIPAESSDEACQIAQNGYYDGIIFLDTVDNSSVEFIGGTAEEMKISKERIPYLPLYNPLKKEIEEKFHFEVKEDTI